MTCTVTFSAVDTRYQALPNTTIKFLPDPQIVRGAGEIVMIPDEEQIITDSAGEGSIALTPGSYICSVVTSFGTRQAKVVIPDAPTALLGDLIDAPIGAWEFSVLQQLRTDVTTIAEAFGGVANLNTIADEVNADAAAADAARIAAETERNLAQAARDAATVNAQLEASTTSAQANAGIPNGGQYQVAASDGLSVIRYRKDSSSASTALLPYPTVLGVQTARGRNVLSFPRDRMQFGLINHPAPTTMALNQATIPSWGRISIPAGSGNRYRTVLSTNFNFDQIGARLLLWIVVDASSGTYSTPQLTAVSTTLGTQTLNFTQEISGLWVLETTIPASGYSSVTFALTSTDAANPVTGTMLHYCIAPTNTDGLSLRREVQSLENMVLDEFREGMGNVWPVEKSSYSVASGTALSAQRVVGITVNPGDEMLVVAYVETSTGGPGIVDRLYVRAVSEVPGTTQSQNIFLEPVAGHPGVYARWLKFSSTLGPTTYLELNVDNAQASAFYPQTAVVVKSIQAYRKPPSSFYSPALLTYPATNGIFVKNFNGLLDVYTPLSATRGNEYMQWQSRRYDKTGDGRGGGVGTVLEDVLLCRRVSSDEFTPVRGLTDVGLNEFAMKQDDGSNQNVGGNVHGAQARRAAPVFKIDDVVQAADTRASFQCSKVEWTEYTQVCGYLTSGTVIANLDTTKIWEGRAMKLRQSITFTQNVNLLTLYLFMFSPYANVDNVSGLGPMFDQIAMPNQGGALYTPGGGVNATYPAETRFICTGPMGWTWDIAVQGSVLPEFRSWWQSGGSSRKLYMSAIGQRDSFGLVPERIPYPVTAGTTISQETWMTVTK